jgi:UDP-N-acetylglucosamine transferase subunit ALG13
VNNQVISRHISQLIQVDVTDKLTSIGTYYCVAYRNLSQSTQVQVGDKLASVAVLALFSVIDTSLKTCLEKLDANSFSLATVGTNSASLVSSFVQRAQKIASL